MGMIFGSKWDDDAWGGGASWWVSSESDPRWNGSGRCSSSIFSMEDAATEHIERKKKELGEPPDDLEMGGMKD